MRNVQRTQKPDVLTRNAKRWKRELLTKLKEVGVRSKDAKSYFAKYDDNNNEVRDALRIMYSGLCCFCECPVDIGATGQIEHLKPTSKFPGLTFESAARCRPLRGRAVRVDRGQQFF